MSRKNSGLNSESEYITVVIPSIVGIFNHLMIISALVFTLRATHSVNGFADHVLVVSLLLAELLFLMGCLRTMVIYNPVDDTIRVRDSFLNREDVFYLSGIKSIETKKVPFLISTSTIRIKTVDGERYCVYLTDTFFANGFVRTMESLMKRRKKDGDH